MGLVKNELLQCASTLERVGMELPITDDHETLIREAEEALDRLRKVGNLPKCPNTGQHPGDD